MATLALAAGGALLGGAGFGSVGASVGWALGGLAGALLFPPRGQDTTGPRLSDLSVQSSAYGTGIPVLFGTTRLAGNILWSSGLREQTNRRRVRGKGSSRPAATTYSYFASWAVGLCEGPAQAIRRIWFDDKLVYDASGASLQIEIPGLVWRFYPGDESQLPDPLIEAAVGSGNAVAHRGLCYLVFDEVPLERLGNRLPNVTCEVVMSGGLSVQNDAITGRPSPVNGTDAAVDWTSRRLWTLTSGAPVRIVETQLGSLASRVVADTGHTLSTGGLAAIPGVGLLYAPFTGNSSPVQRYDMDTGALTGSFGSANIGLSNTTSNVTSIGFRSQDIVPLQVQGASGLRSFLLLSPFTFDGGGFCLDVDSMAYVWGSTATGHPRLFVPGARGAWVVGERREGETDAFYLAGRSGFVELWRVTVTAAAAGITSGSGIGGTLGVTATRLADIPAASLGHGAGVIEVRQAIWDLEDASLVLGTSLAGVERLSKAMPGGAVLWSVSGPFSQNRVGHLSRLDAGVLAVLHDNLIQVYSTRDGAPLASQPVPGSGPSIAGWQIFEGSTRALYAQTQGAGARRFLVMRQGSNSVSLSSVVQALCARAGLEPGDLNTAALTEQVAGYVIARPGTVRSALEPLGAAYQFDAVESDDVLRCMPRGGAPVATLAHGDLVRAGERAVITETRAQDVELPRQLTLRHFNPDRAYEPGAQHWQRPLAPSPTMRSRDVQTLDLPLVLSADAAKATARRLLTATWRERQRFDLTATTQHLRLEPTDPVTLVLADGSTQRARILSAQLGADWTLRLEAVAEAAADYTLTATADPGRGYVPEAVPAPYGIRALVPNLPLLRDGDDLAGTGLRGYALAGTYPGQAWRTSQLWRGALADLDLLGALDEGMAWGAVVGGVPAPATYWTWDDATTITLAPQSGAARITSATELEVLNGANLGLLVSPEGVVELIQHASAVAHANGTLTLSRLLRGRRGTEDAGAFAAAVYVLLDGAELPFSSPLASLGQSETYRVQGAFQQVQEARGLARIHTGRAERPYAPVHLTGTRDGANNLTLAWTRRARLGGALLDGTGTVPLGEASEAYEVDIRNAADTATLRTITGISLPTATYTAAQQTADGLTPGAPVRVRVFQISATVGRGIPGSALL